jgi:hypothetical protein
MKTLAAVTVFALTACSQRVYSPPTQAFAVGPVTALPAGGSTLDVELATHSQLFDPGLHSAAGRYARSIGDRTEVTAEGTAFTLEGSGTRSNIYAGRGGVRTSPGDDLSFFAGAGGGYAPIGGSFASLDAGVSFGIDNCYVVPVMTFAGFVSQPLDPRPIDVTVDPKEMTYDTPSRTVGGTARGGLRVDLTPSSCKRGEAGTWIYGGLDVTTVVDKDTTDSLMGFGVGVSVPL